MIDAWVIAMGDRLVNGTNAGDMLGAWNAFYLTYFTIDERDLIISDFIEQQKRCGYSAVCVKYKITKREGPEK